MVLSSPSMLEIHQAQTVYWPACTFVVFEVNVDVACAVLAVRCGTMCMQG